MLYTVLLSARAIRDLQTARDYLAQLAPETADQWYSNVLRSLLRLEKNPETRPLAPENDEFPFELDSSLSVPKAVTQIVRFSQSWGVKCVCWPFGGLGNHC